MEPWRIKCSEFRKKLEDHTPYLQKLLKYFEDNDLERIKQKEICDIGCCLALGGKDKNQVDYKTATRFEDACKSIQNLILKYPVSAIDALIDKNKNGSDRNYKTLAKKNSRVDLNLNSAETVLLPNPNYSGQPNNADVSIHVNKDPKVKKSVTQDYRIKTAENLNRNSSQAISKLVCDRANNCNTGIPPGAGWGRGRGRGNRSSNGVGLVHSSEYAKDQFATFELSRPGRVAAAAAWDDMELEDEIKRSSSASGSTSPASVSANTGNPNRHPDRSNKPPISAWEQQFERQRQEDFLATQRPQRRTINGNEVKMNSRERGRMPLSENIHHFDYCIGHETKIRERKRSRSPSMLQPPSTYTNNGSSFHLREDKSLNRYRSRSGQFDDTEDYFELEQKSKKHCSSAESYLEINNKARATHEPSKTSSQLLEFCIHDKYGLPNPFAKVHQGTQSQSKNEVQLSFKPTTPKPVPMEVSCEREQRHSHRPVQNVKSRDMVCNPLFKSNNIARADAVVTTSGTPVKPDQYRREQEQFNIQTQTMLDVTLKVPGNLAPITTISQQIVPAPIPQLSLVETPLHQGFASPLPVQVFYPNQNQTYPTSSSFLVLDIQKYQNLPNVGSEYPQQQQMLLTPMKTKSKSHSPISLIPKAVDSNNCENTRHYDNEFSTDPHLEDLDTVPFAVPESPPCNRQLGYQNADWNLNMNQNEDPELNADRSHKNSEDISKENKPSNTIFESRPYLTQLQPSALNGDDNNDKGATELSSSKLITPPLRVRDKLATPGLCALGKKLPRTAKIFEEVPLPPMIKSKTNGTGISDTENCKGFASIAAEEIDGVVTAKNRDSKHSQSRNGQATNKIYSPQNAIKKASKGKIIKRQGIKMKFPVCKKPSIPATVASSSSKSYLRRKPRVVYSSSSDSEDGGGSSQMEVPSNSLNVEGQEHQKSSQMTSNDILSIIMKSLLSRGFSVNEIGNIMYDPAALKELYAILKMKIKTTDGDSASKGLKSNPMNRKSTPKKKPAKRTARNNLPKKPVVKEKVRPRRNSALSAKIKFMRALGLRPAKIKERSRPTKPRVSVTARKTRSSTSALKLKLQNEEKSKSVTTSLAAVAVTTSNHPDSISTPKDLTEMTTGADTKDLAPAHHVKDTSTTTDQVKPNRISPRNKNEVDKNRKNDSSSSEDAQNKTKRKTITYQPPCKMNPGLEKVKIESDYIPAPPTVKVEPVEYVGPDPSPCQE